MIEKKYLEHLKKEDFEAYCDVVDDPIKGRSDTDGVFMVLFVILIILLLGVGMALYEAFKSN